MIGIPKDPRDEHTGLGLTLFVGGSHPTSIRAREALEEALTHYQSLAALVTIVDVFEEPRAALASGVVATPSLLASDRERRLWLIGDLEDRTELDVFLKSFVDGLGSAGDREPTQRDAMDRGT